MVVPKLVFVGVFGGAALACFGSLWRVQNLPDAAVRRGLAGLLGCSGLWAAAQAGRLLVGPPALKIGFYLIGLTTGLASVGAWLYFCSAYAGLDYHQNPRVRLTAVGLYLGIVAVKLTNPLHQQYFTARVVETPYPHLVIQQLAFHWLVLGLAYVLSAIGLYILYDVLRTSKYPTTSLGIVLSFTILPIGLTLAGQLWPQQLLELSYEPLGVAAFAIGVLYFVEEKFVAVPRFGRQEVIDTLADPVVLLDHTGALRDYNPAATQAFPELDGQTGRPLATVAPALAGLEDTAGMLTMARGDGERYYLRKERELAIGTTTLGRALMFTDVTELEQQRKELERQNEQLDDLDDAITHELRNALTIIRGHIELAADRLPEETDPVVDSSLATVDRTADRMNRVVSDLSSLARHGQTLDEIDECQFRETVERAWTEAASEDLTLTVEGDGVVEADSDRLVALFSDAFQFAASTGATSVTVHLAADRFTIATDGQSVPPDEAAEAFEYGGAVPNAEAGMTLPNVRTLARVHGWDVRIDEAYDTGVRLVVEGVSIAQH